MICGIRISLSPIYIFFVNLITFAYGILNATTHHYFRDRKISLNQATCIHQKKKKKGNVYSSKYQATFTVRIFTLHTLLGVW